MENPKIYPGIFLIIFGLLSLILSIIIFRYCEDIPSDSPQKKTSEHSRNSAITLMVASCIAIIAGTGFCLI